MTTDVLGTTANATKAWIPDDSTFGARLALVRQRMSWGNIKLAAEACGLPAESWRTWERDGVEPRGLNRIARKIAERTGCDYGWLLDGPNLAGRQPVSAIAPYLEKAERPTSNLQRPPNNRPTGHPSGGSRPTIRRTSRLPRPASRTED